MEQNLIFLVKRSLMESIKDKFESKEAWRKLTVIFLFKEIGKILKGFDLKLTSIEVRNLITGYATIKLLVGLHETFSFDINYQELIY